MLTSSDLTPLILSGDAPSNTLSKILSLYNIHADSLESIVEATQKVWLRDTRIERWDIPSQPSIHDAQLSALLDELPFVNEVHPSRSNYDHVLIFGDTVNGMRQRYAYALELYNKGIRFNNLSFLVGQRPRFEMHLDADDRESILELYDRHNQFLRIKSNWQEPSTPPSTETEIARMIVDQTELPAEFIQDVDIRFIDTPLQGASDGLLRKPNTGDTLKRWLQTAQPMGTVLAVSNQPYIGYQHAVLKTYASEILSIESAGPGLAEPVSLNLLLDTLARWLYQENIFQKKMHLKR